jgi:gliding motility-associated-like protein
MRKIKNQLIFFILSLFLVISGFPIFAQNEANVWLINNGLQLNFDSGQPELLEFKGQTEFGSSICDKEGNFLLYSDGRKIWNKNHEVIVSGNNLIGKDSWIQNLPFFLPHPEKEGWFIFIYEEMTYWIQGGKYGNTLYYGEINTKAHGGKGEFVTQNVFIHDNYHSHPTIAGYCNNSYYWLAIDRNENVISDINRDRIYFYRIDENGVNKTPVINGELENGNSGGYRFSPNGDKLFFATYGTLNADGQFVTDFNFKTGELYNFRRVNFDDALRNVFSPNSRFFYFFSGLHLCQLDTRYTDPRHFNHSVDTLLTLQKSAAQGNNGQDLRLAPDGKIYFVYTDSRMGERKLGRIRFPNSKGMECMPELDVLTFPTSNIRIPEFMPGFFRKKLPEPLDEVFPDAGEDQELCPGDIVFLGKENQPEAFYSWIPEKFISDYYTAQTELKAPPHYNATEIDTFTLRATDGNCWLNFDEVEITRFPENLPLEIGGSWSVCPFVEEVDYRTENNNYSYNPVWLVEGGEIVSGQGADSIKVNWGETNFEAKVGVFSVNSFGCNSDTTWFPVRINVELLTEKPNGPNEICIAKAQSVKYLIHNTNGSVYDWTANGGEIVMGQGTNRVVVNWLTEGVHSLIVKETSTTIDTVCYGESEMLQVTVINDSLNIELENVSFNSENNVEIVYRSDKLTPHRHVLYIVSNGEETGRIVEDNLSGWNDYDGSTLHFTIKEQLESETIRLRVHNSCNEIMWSNPLQTIVLKVVTVFGQQVRLAWNENRFWEMNRVKYELWHAENETESWELVVEDLNELRFDFLNTGMGLTHFFRIKAIHIDEDKVSWSNWVKAELEDVIEIPDVFTPNGDGFNDKWEIPNIRFHELQRATIYNRHGQKVFECRNEYIPWDGMNNGKVIQGTYFYELVFGDGTIKHGQLTILQ